MPLYYLVVGRRTESVLGVHEYRRGFDRSISGCVCQNVTTMLYLPSVIADVGVATARTAPAKDEIEVVSED